MSSLMLQHSSVRARWKEWIPLVTQQQRFRNLIQIVGYNIGLNEDKNRSLKDISYYYTLHFTTMCAPFYTSEKISKEHPKWSEVNFLMIDPSYGSATGIVVRVWQQYKNEDTIVTVWGVYFSGLSYIGPHIKPNEGLTFAKNTLVFLMHGGYFTSPDCLLDEEPLLARITTMSMNPNDIRRSYTVHALSKLHAIQRSMKESTEESVTLHNKILLGEFPDDKSQVKESSAFLRKLLNQTKPVKVSHEQILDIKKKIEMKRFRVQLLQEQKLQKLTEIKKRNSIRNSIMEANEEEGAKLFNRYYILNKDMDHLKEWKKAFLEGKENLSSLKSQFWFRQKQLIAELTHIYPIKNIGNKYTIGDIHLPNSEDFAGINEISLGVALGFAAHVVQKISYIINIPLRYPIIHYGSRSKIVDHIADQIPEKDREFPLFVRGKDKLPFNYAVYLLNKNIAQLRWYCGISTSDLRATLPNLETLLCLYSIQKSAFKDPRFTSDSLARLSSISRNTIQYSSIPRRFNYRKSDRLTCSLDEGLDKWDGKNKNDNPARHVSEPLSRDEGQSSDSVEHDYHHQIYVSAESSSIDTNEKTTEEHLNS